MTKRVHNNYYNLKQLRRQQQTPIHMDVHTYYYVCVSVCVCACIINLYMPKYNEKMLTSFGWLEDAYSYLRVSCWNTNMQQQFQPKLEQRLSPADRHGVFAGAPFWETQRSRPMVTWTFFASNINRIITSYIWVSNTIVNFMLYLFFSFFPVPFYGFKVGY